MRIWLVFGLTGAVNVTESECRCDLSVDLCECCCDLDCSADELALLTCSSETSGPNKPGVAVNNSLYLGEYYPRIKTRTQEEINEAFAAFDTTRTSNVAVSCGGNYCAGDQLNYEVLGVATPLEVTMNSLGQCGNAAVRVFGSSSITCPDSVYSCPTLSSVALSDLCVDSACTVTTDAELVVDYLIDPLTVSDPSLYTNCIRDLWYRVTMIPHGTGYRIYNFTIYVDYGLTPSLVPGDVKVTLSPFSPFVFDTRNPRAYRPGQLLTSNTEPDFSPCQKTLKLKMGGLSQTSCFDSTLFLTADDCQTRFDKINQSIVNSGFYTPEYSMYPSGAENITVVVDQPADYPTGHSFNGSCLLPGHIAYTFIYQEHSGDLFRLEGLHIRHLDRLFQTEESYRLKLTVDFVRRIGARETKWVSPFKNYLADIKLALPKMTSDPVFLLLILIGAVIPIVIYLYVERDVHLHAKVRLD